MSERRRAAGRSRRARGHGWDDPDVEVAEVVDGTEVEADDRRFEGLHAAVSRLRVRAKAENFERPLMIAGAILLPLGLVAIVLGWVGASQSPYMFEQIPYLISGGLLGLALAVVGGFLYFGYWLTRMISEQRTQADRVAGALERLERMLGGDAVGGNGHASSSPVREARSRARRRASAEFVATATGSMFHRRDCVVVQDRSGLKPVSGEEQGYEPCAICEPLTV